MPSAEDTSYLFKVMSNSDQYHHHHHDLSSRDVDVLVSRIKENLRLTTNFKSKSSVVNKSRAAPYKLPVSRTTCEYCLNFNSKNANSNNNNNNNSGNSSCNHLPISRFLTTENVVDYTVEDLEDSNERFQALLRDGALIKEAVKRLRKLKNWYSDNGIDIDSTGCLLDIRRKQYFYDEEDDVSQIEL